MSDEVDALRSQLALAERERDSLRTQTQVQHEVIASTTRLLAAAEQERDSLRAIAAVVCAERDWLREALRGLVDALPRCRYACETADECTRPATAWEVGEELGDCCDEHAEGERVEHEYAPAIRAALAVLESSR